MTGSRYYNHVPEIELNWLRSIVIEDYNIHASNF